MVYEEIIQRGKDKNKTGLQIIGDVAVYHVYVGTISVPLNLGFGFNWLLNSFWTSFRLISKQREDGSVLNVPMLESYASTINSTKWLIRSMTCYFIFATTCLQLAVPT